MLRAYEAKALPAALENQHRKARAAAVLVDAAERFGHADNFEAPFGTKKDADTAYAWWKRAQARDPGQKGLRMPVQLARASWARTAPDSTAAGALAAQVVASEAQGDLTPREAYLVR